MEPQKIFFLSAKKFNRIRKLLPPPGPRERMNDLVFLSAVIYIIKNCLPWRLLPKEYGKWTTVYSRFKRWSKIGIFDKIFRCFSAKLKKRWTGMIDSTYTKAHRTAASMAYDGKPRLLGRSHGGITTKIHVLCDENRMPRDLMITGGEVNDAKVATDLIDRNRMKCLIADKAYHSKKIRKALKNQKAKACIPTKSNSKEKIPYDKELYKTRHKIENLFSDLKDWRGIAFRTCRCSHTYSSFVYIAMVVIFY